MNDLLYDICARRDHSSVAATLWALSGLTVPIRVVKTWGRSGAEGETEAGAEVGHQGGSAGVYFLPRKVFVAASACPKP